MSAVEMEEAVRNVMEITSRHTEEDKHLFREAIKVGPAHALTGSWIKPAVY